MKRIAQALAALSLIGLASAVPTAAMAASAPKLPAACATNWGTNAKHHGSTATVRTAVRTVRAGKHACFDRLVIVLGTGPEPAYRAEYVKKIIADGSGQVLSVRGRAKILITVRGPAASGYHANAVNLVNVSGFPTFRQVRGAGSFERVTSVGVGVAAKLPFRAFILGSSSAGWRLVVDVMT
jgi:hypothetical protein